jgi:uridine kinase
MKGRPVVAAIVGGSGSGKTWLSRKIEQALPGQVTRVSLDDFYLDRSHLKPKARRRVNYDHPRAIDWPALQRFVEDYVSEKSVLLPQYDFTTHCRRRGGTNCEVRPILLIEGLWVLSRRCIRSMVDFSIYMECPAPVRLARRVARDTMERGRTVRDVRAQFRAIVAPMHHAYVAPQKRHVAVVLRHPITDADAEMLAARLRTMLEERQGPEQKIIYPPQVDGCEGGDWRDVA